MRKYLLLVLIGTSLYAQEKSQVIYKNEIVTISNKNSLEIESYFTESRLITKSKNQYEYVISVPYNSFNEISEIKGSTLIQKSNKKHTLYSSSIREFDAEEENIFKSDTKIKQFLLPFVEDNSVIEYSFKNKIKQPRFLSVFRFQNPLKTQSSKLTIHCDSNVELGFKVFGEHQDKIVFTKSTNGNIDTYTWLAKEVPEFELEEDMPNALYVQPHIIYYIKKYNNKGQTEELLENASNLYSWYYTLVKNINKKDQTALKNATLNIIKDKASDLEKAQAIYYWVQQNLHYVAFEDGMGGFIPREAADVHSKLYGDCKDMANLLNEMFRYANLKSNLTWIGTRLKPYTYEEVPTPQVDNHMITHLEIDGKSYFLDATDKFCSFFLPTSHIQGKEALIGNDEKFNIKKVPVVESSENSTSMTFDLKIEDKSVKGLATVYTNGYSKSELLNILSNFPQKQKEIWKSIINATNSKINLEPIEFATNEYKNTPSKATFNLQLEDAVKDINGKLLVKPIIVFPLKDTQIDIEKRKYPVESEYNQLYKLEYQYEIPTDYKVEFLPENSKNESDVASFEIQYKVQNNLLLVSQKVTTKKLLIEKSDFEKWNAFLKLLNKQYNQSIILTK
ncbi:DUF3857 domain-containing transglutaminase family protein [Flavobacterium urocaniciphilum]|uniref:Transglutaminase-like superfamily protein n=1 Tax=Flavobacterium urocaniciphilum TaxID=1299341 RepID=A0A1H9BSD5_9FLAO|nr:DUF3857 domain-containing protein [Flavobacterium urocaniciphilum]SEP91904.1 Transglutaminase-like superfamily protein [Flavobacterium urocaniciphilum]